MEVGTLAEVLRATGDPNQRRAAEEQLKRMEKMIGMAPALLHILESQEIEMPTRLAGAIYLKNLIQTSWEASSEDNTSCFRIHQRDRTLICNALVDVIVRAPPLIREQLCVCLKVICRSDFAERYPFPVDSIAVCLLLPDASVWPGALSALLALVKVFEHRKESERVMLDDAMDRIILPLVQSIVGRLREDVSTAGLLILRLVLQVYFALTRYYLPLQILGTTGQWERFHGWMEVVCYVLNRDNPDLEKKPQSEDERNELEKNEWWKTKQTAMRILYRMFKRYGSPGRVSKPYAGFALHYLLTYSEGALAVVFRILESYRKGNYVTDQVLRNAILYLKNAVSYAHSWKFIKPYANDLVTVMLPLMCHTEEDERLWKEDPIEVARSRCDAVDAGEQLLNAMCKNRRGVLPSCIQLVSQLLNDPNTPPMRKDGALHMVGAVADILLKQVQYKEQCERFLIHDIFPSMTAPYPFLRARAAWVLSKLSMLKFSREEILCEVVRVLTDVLLNKDEELPVKIEAGFAIEAFIIDQHRTHQYFQNQIGPLCMELLQIPINTLCDDLINVLQKIVRTIVFEVGTLVQICHRLAQGFIEILEVVGDADGEKSSVATGLLSTMKIVVEVLKEQPQIFLRLEPILYDVVVVILDKSIMEFYDEAFYFIACLTEINISPAMWQVFDKLYWFVQQGGIKYFVKLMPALYNYITVDADAFLTNHSRLQAVFIVINKVLSDDSAKPGEDTKCSALKFVEVLILQHRHHIQQFIPNLLRLAVENLSRHIIFAELRTMCLLVVAASICHDLNFTLSVIAYHMNDVVSQWITDVDCFIGLHNRKVCVLGLCGLLQSQQRPAALYERSKEVLPSLIHLLDGLKRDYAAKAKALKKAESDSEEEEEEDEYCEIEEVLSTDEDELCEEGAEDGVTFQRNTAEKKTSLESYATPLDDEESLIDEFVIFKEVLMNLERSDPVWFSALTSSLNGEQRKSVQEIFTFADQRKAAAESKAILKRGGYQFTQLSVPSSFNFRNGNLPAIMP